MPDSSPAPDPASESPRSSAEPPRPEVLQILLENHRAFLSFLERRVGDRAAAEDILQDAFVRGMERAGQLRDGEAAVAWFYRLLRNAVVDRWRRGAAAGRALEGFAAEMEVASEPPPEIANEICACVGRLAAALKPEYAEALRRIEVDGMAVKDYAAEVGITATNAGVRIFRAREALRREVERSCRTCATHGCIDCTCGGESGAPGV
ncbi:MAG TPA: sigma-70 family RNA polymerase sigma factor [Acidobacteriota bacterium]|nr:sigma-70 family RNA polymerase sigma factor [Acidobacteriota bacterium]